MKVTVQIVMSMQEMLLEQHALLLEQDYELLMLSHALKENDAVQVQKSKQRLEEIHTDYLQIKIKIANRNKRNNNIFLNH